MVWPIHGVKLSFGNQKLEIKRLKLFTNGKIYAIATITDPSSGQSNPLLLCIDPANLSLLTVTKLVISNGIANWRGVDLNEGRSNTLFILCNNDSLLNVTKSNYISSTISWSKTYHARNSPRPIAIGVEYNDIYVAWNETDSGYSKGVMMSLHEISGNYRFGSRAGGKL